MGKKIRAHFLAICLLALCGATAATAGPPLDPRLTPQWHNVTTVTEVAYAPNLPVDVFRYQGRFYCYDGRWYQSQVWGGPWRVIPEPPAVLRQVDAAYFKKVPPGWSRGRKVGWQGGSMPPGQARKQQGGLPPGQAKKRGF
ncbi:MAG: hypothetical protein K6T55_02890 [Syntrophobacterales bacterium]|nr:hypothetical protein [Syntrophobacterales bacterium]